MTLAYLLAISDVESDKLCEESTFAAMFVGRSFTWLEREQIGSEAGAIRGDETWDWIVPNISVVFYHRLLGGRQHGVIERIVIERSNNMTIPYALIRHNINRRQYKVEFFLIQLERD